MITMNHFQMLFSDHFQVPFSDHFQFIAKLFLQHMITFVYSVPKKLAGVKLPVYPVQIIPYSRSYINDTEIIGYPNISDNIGSVVHASYLCRPFGKKLTEFANIHQLESYCKLCSKISYNFLVHGPANADEMSRYEIGMAILREKFKDFKGKVLIETPSMNSQYKPSLDEYFSHIAREFDEKFEICIDTAHMHANGWNVDDIIAVCEKYNDKISTIHLNGNSREPYHSDEHVAIFSPANNLKDVDKLMKYFAKKNYLMIAEITRPEYKYEDWAQFAKKYELKIVDFSEKLIISRERIL